MFLLAGKHAVVTGAAGDIGRAICLALVEAGVDKIAVLGRSQEKLLALEKDLHLAADAMWGDTGKAPLSVVSVVWSVTSSAAAPATTTTTGSAATSTTVTTTTSCDDDAAVIRSASDLLGGIDILVCNAGMTRDRTFQKMSSDEWRDVLRLNLEAPLAQAKEAFRLRTSVCTTTDAGAATVPPIPSALSSALSPSHSDKGEDVSHRLSRVIFVTSIVAHTGNFGQTNYVASKAALGAAAKCLASEYAKAGVTVNSVAPGFIQTRMTDVIPEERKQAIKATIPLGDFGHTKDVAAAVVFCASREAAYMTGQTMHINGGKLMP